jgi:hypothetical protein
MSQAPHLADLPLCSVNKAHPCFFNSFCTPSSSSWMREGTRWNFTGTVLDKLKCSRPESVSLGVISVSTFLFLLSCSSHSASREGCASAVAQRLADEWEGEGLRAALVVMRPMGCNPGTMSFNCIHHTNIHNLSFIQLFKSILTQLCAINSIFKLRV